MKLTVFILGAGASQSFGFPIGQQLYEDVILFLQPQSSGAAALRGLEFDADEIERFRAELSHSGRASVDAFLEHRPECMKIGKAAMAYVLIGKEHPNGLFRDTGNWLGYLYRHIPNPLRELDHDVISFLTFNYDRSVEHYLFSALNHGFGASVEACVAALAKVPIIHLHGSLGPLPWQNERHNRPYDSIADSNAIAIGASGIKIVHEDISDGRDKEFQRAKELLVVAERVYFLGFGYDRINMQRLDLRNIRQGICWGTGLGLTGREVQDIENAIDSRITILSSYDCLGFLRNEVSWN